MPTPLKKKKKQDSQPRVKQVVISALLDALNEIIGPDGKDSIIKYAGLDEKYLSKYLRPTLKQWLPKGDLLKIADAMYRLIGWGSKALLRETGRKFSIFLVPYGYDLDTVARKLEEWIEGDWGIDIQPVEEGRYKITIKNDPFKSKKPGSYLWMGFFEIAATNSSKDGAKYVATDLEMSEDREDTFFFLLRKD